MVQASHFLSAKKSRQLIKKIASLTSANQASELRRQVYIAGRPKSTNESVYYVVDAIHTAVQLGRQISFHYFDYNTKKQPIFRKNGEMYTQSPVALCWSDDHYYMVTHSARWDDFVHFRVDRMCDVEISAEKSEWTEPDFDAATYDKRFFNMYGGRITKVKLRFANHLVNSVLDRFGKDISLQASGDYFTCTLDLSVSPTFMGWMFQFGNDAEILEPKSLRKEMAQLCKSVIAQYK